MPIPSDTSRSDAWARGGAVLFLLGAVGIAYSNAVRTPFVFDDASAVVANRTIQHLGDLKGVFTPPLTGVTAGRPLLNLTYAVNYALSGPSPVAYHLVNVAVHFLAAVTLFGVIRRTAKSTSAAFAVALLWALHPLQTEAVTYVSQRAESAMGLLYLLTLYGFVRYSQSEAKTRWAILSVACCACGMAVKETMMSAPVVILLYDRAFCSPSFRKALAVRRIYYAALASSWLLLAALMVRFDTLTKSNAGFRTGVGPLHYALAESRAIVGYLRLAVWPAGLTFDHPSLLDKGAPFSAGGVGLVVVDVAFIALLVAAAVWAWRRSPAVGFLACSFFILLSPTSSVVPIASCPMAESRMYLPLASLIVLVVLGLRAWNPRACWAIVSILAVVLGAATFGRNVVYASPVSIWRDTLTKVPGSERAQLNLATELGRLPDGEAESESTYQTVLKSDPDNVSAHFGLANEWSRDPAKTEQAIAEYRLAQRADPSFAEARVNLGNLYTRITGAQQAAIEEYRAAVRIRPDYPEAHFNLGVVLAQIPGGLLESCSEYEQALKFEPDYAAADYNLASNLSRMPGRKADAIRHYEDALRIQPDNAATHLNLGNLLATIRGREGEAIAHYQAALAIQPRYPLAENNLGQVYELLGKRSEAIRHWQTALEIQSDFELARANLTRTEGH